MGLNHQNINEYLARFWEGQTTLEEERAIKEFFRYNTAPEGHEDLAAYFALTNQEETVSDDFDEWILSQISGPDQKKHIHFDWRVAAAVLVIAVGGYFFMRNDSTIDPPLADAANTELIDQEVQEAFEQTKQALFLIGNKLNEGQEIATKLNKFNVAQDAIKAE